jgi:hypothetical protein
VVEKIALTHQARSLSAGRAPAQTRGGLVPLSRTARTAGEGADPRISVRGEAGEDIKPGSFSSQMVHAGFGMQR